MKILILIFTLIFVSFCLKNIVKDKDNLTIINHLSTFKYTYSNDSTYTEVDSLKIIFNGDITMYEVQTVNYAPKKHSVSNDTLVYELYPADTSITHYVSKKGLKVGLKYDSFSSKDFHKFILDTLLADKGLNEENMKIYGMDFGKIISTKQNKHIRIDVYTPPKLGLDYVDTVYRFYDKRLLGIDFSFSKKLDREMRTKLNKIHLVTLYPKAIKSSKPILIRDDIVQEIQRVNINYEKEIINLLERFEKDCKKLKLN